MTLLVLIGCSPFSRYEQLYQIGGAGAVEGQGTVVGVAAAPRGLFLAESRSTDVPLSLTTLAATTPVVLTRTAAVTLDIDARVVASDASWVVAGGPLGGIAVTTAIPEAPELLFEGAIAQAPILEVAVVDGVAWAISEGPQPGTGQLHRLDLQILAQDPSDAAAAYTWVDLPGPPRALAVGGGTVWTLPDDAGRAPMVTGFGAATLDPRGTTTWDPVGNGDILGALYLDGRVFVGTPTHLHVLDVSAPFDPRWTGILEDAGGAPESLTEGTIWVRQPEEGGIRLVDPDRLRARGTFEGVCPDRFLDLLVLGRTFYAACGEGGLRVFAEHRDWEQTPEPP
ncbi:MAG: hypothetical protein H6736_20560 [Alphaproteobacteria bacterium]|nr:hypothetical protein [Alphaproteobacteria bacterium]MCB9694210.1 hypothetical protein [Alphaproteobacteria bacterium]